MIPNLGQTGNMAVKDAMALASSLADLLSISFRPTTAETRQSLVD
jgi:2-polyprenyl-6-methoxyphenol hydroxylase-like FAD-dependent oxidoreductase